MIDQKRYRHVDESINPIDAIHADDIEDEGDITNESDSD